MNEREDKNSVTHAAGPSALEPCPWCGKPGKEFGGKYAKCPDIFGCPGGSVYATIEDWNRRAPAPQGAAPAPGGVEAQRDQALALVAKSQDRAIRLLDKQNAKLDEQEAKLRTAEAQAAPQEGEALDLEAALGDLLAEHEDWIRSSSQGRVNPSERHTVIAARKALARLRAGRPA